MVGHKRRFVQGSDLMREILCEKKNTLCVVMPVYNEQDAIGGVL